MLQNRSSSCTISSSRLMVQAPSSLSRIFMKVATDRPTFSSSKALRVCARLRTVSSFMSCASRRRHTLSRKEGSVHESNKVEADTPKAVGIVAGRTNGRNNGAQRFPKLQRKTAILPRALVQRHGRLENDKKNTAAL